MVKAPTPEEEDRRRLCRERKVLIAEQSPRQPPQRAAVLPGDNRLQAATPRPAVAAGRTPDRRWTSVPEHLNAQIRRELDRLELLLEQIKAVEVERDTLLAAEDARASTGDDVARHQGHWARVRRHSVVGRAVPTLRQPTTGRCLCWLGADTLAEWISRSRARRVQVRQSTSANNTDPARLAMATPSATISLALWFEARVKRNGGRFKKTTIVALARKLLVALWKYVTTGVMIEGAAMKTA